MFFIDPEKNNDHLEKTTAYEALQCNLCGDELCHPVDSHALAEEDRHKATGSAGWVVSVECPNCESVDQIFMDSQEVKELYDTQVEGLQVLRHNLQSITHSNMVREIEIFADALRKGYIIPEDF